jgi:hypothetical protein
MRSSALLLLLSPAAIGCTTTVSGSGPSDAEPTLTTSAVIVVERMVNETDGFRAEANARFVRVAWPYSSHDALQAIGAALDLPAVGACGSIARAAGAVPDQRAPFVELVDVGPVSLEVGGGLTRLVPRQLPDVTDVVSGVVYARATDPASLPASTRYFVHIGRPGPEAFDVQAVAPADPGNVRIAGDDGHGTIVAMSRPIEFAWAADGSEGTSTAAPSRGQSQADLVYVDIHPAGVRCVLGDAAGAGPELVRASLPPSLLDDAGTLVVHRLHREALHAQGWENGEIRFDFARSVAYVRR